MTTHRGIRIIHKGKTTDFTNELSNLFMNYIEKKMNLDDNLSRAEFNIACKKIIMVKNNEPTFIF